MKTLTKKVLQLIPTLFCVVALSGVNPAWAKHCQSWNVACKKAEQLQEEAQRKAANARAAAERAAANAKAEAEKARANPKQYAENAGKAVAKGVNQAAKATVNFAVKQSVSLAQITKGVSRNKDGIWYSTWPGQKVRLQGSFGAGAGAGGEDSPSAPVSDSKFDGDGNTNWPAEVKKYGEYYKDRPGQYEDTPLKVSHKNRQSSVDNQGWRGTCTAFATAAAIESLLGGDKKISKEFIYSKIKNGDTVKTCNGHGAWPHQIHEVLKSKKFPEEKHWGYMMFPVTAGGGIGVCPGDPPEAAKNNAVWGVTGDIYRFGSLGLESVSNPAFLEAWLAAGYDVILFTGVAWKHETFLKISSYELLPWAGDLADIIDVKKVNGKAAPVQGNHAMLIVGYDRNNNDKIGGGYFTVKNSWGTDKGKGGYLRLSYDYIRQYARDGMVITAVGKR